MKYKYKAFISYSHKDEKFAKWLHKRLESYKIPHSLREKYPNLPKNLKRSIFIDKEELSTSSLLSENLKHSLENSKKLIVICSPSAVASKWVNEEIRYFKEVHGEFSVLAIIKDGEPNALSSSFYDDASEAFPDSLRYEVGEDGKVTNKETELLASDARKGNDKKMALLKLIAGILGVEFADLWEREKREARKRGAIVTVLVVVFIVVSLYAFTMFFADKGNDEIEQIDTKIAIIEKSIRDNNLSMEEIISCNREKEKLELDKDHIRDRLKWVKKYQTNYIEKAESIRKEKGDAEAIKYIKSNKDIRKAKREQAHKRYSKGLIYDAKIYIENYMYQDAKKMYKEAIDEFFDYDNVMEYTQFLDKQNKYKQAIYLLKKLLTIKLNEHQRILLYTNLGLEYSMNNEREKAIKMLNKSIELATINLDKSNKPLHRILKLLVDGEEDYFAYNSPNIIGQSYQVLGSLYKKENNFAKAEENYIIGLGLISSSNNLKQKITALANLGNFYLSIGDYEKSKIRLKEALELSLKEKRKDKKDELSYIYQKLGIVYIYTKDKSSIEYFEKSLVILNELVKFNPIAYKPRLAELYNDMAFMYHFHKDFEKSEYYYFESLRIKKSLYSYNQMAYINTYIQGYNNLIKLYLEYKKVDNIKIIINKIEKDDFSKINTVYSNFSGIFANHYNQIGVLLIENNDTENANKMFLKSLEIHKIISSKKKNILHYADALYNVATRMIYKNPKGAKKYYLEALELYKSLEEDTIAKYTYEIADTYYGLIYVYESLNQLEKAIDMSYFAIDLYSELAKKKKKYREQLLHIIEKLDVLYRRLNDKYKISQEEILIKSTQLYKKLVKNNFDEYQNILVWNSIQLGALKYSQNKLKEAQNYYEDVLTFDSKNSSAFINLYELEIITNQEINQTFEKMYVKVYQDKKKKFIEYEMLKIIKNITKNRKVDIESWEKRYKGIYLDWSFKELKEWVKTLKDEKIRKCIYEALEVFEKHNDTVKSK